MHTFTPVDNPLGCPDDVEEWGMFPKESGLLPLSSPSPSASTSSRIISSMMAMVSGLSRTAGMICIRWAIWVRSWRPVKELFPGKRISSLASQA